MRCLFSTMEEGSFFLYIVMCIMHCNCQIEWLPGTFAREPMTTKTFLYTLHLFCLFNLLSFLLIPFPRGGRILIWLMYLKPYHTSFFLCIFWNFSERLLSFRHREKEKESKTLFKDVDWEAHLIYVVSFFLCVWVCLFLCARPRVRVCVYEC